MSIGLGRTGNLVISSMTTVTARGRTAVVSAPAQIGGDERPVGWHAPRYSPPRHGGGSYPVDGDGQVLAVPPAQQPKGAAIDRDV
jgi:hypothetical protein